MGNDDDGPVPVRNGNGGGGGGSIAQSFNIGSDTLHFARSLLSFCLWPLLGVFFGFRRGYYGIYVVVVYLRIFVDLLLFAFVRSLRYFGGYAQHRSYLQAEPSFKGWFAKASRLDRNEGHDLWRQKLECEDYDWELLQQHHQKLIVAMKNKDMKAVMRSLEHSFQRNHSGLNNAGLYGFRSRVGTKVAIEHYLDDVEKALHWVLKTRDFNVSAKDKLAFFKRGYSALGTTALCLSGGGALAMYHMGVVKALISTDLLPNVISGTSGGAIVAGVLAIHSNEEMMHDMIRADISNRYGKKWFPPVFQQLQSFYKYGLMMDWEWFAETCKAYFGHYTFAEAFERTGRAVNIAVSRADLEGKGKTHKPIILNHINSPHVCIWSAVTASCAIPGLMGPVPLVGKDERGGEARQFEGMLFMDGSILADVPEVELRRLYNTNNFIVSQVNPHISPFVKQARGIEDFQPSVFENLEILINKDIKYRVTRLCEKDLMPRFFGQDVRGVFTQQYKSTTREHVVIVPSYSPFDGYQAISHPEESDMKRFIRKGLVSVWGKVAQIRSRSQIELIVGRCLRETEELVASEAKANHHQNRKRDAVGGGGGGPGGHPLTADDLMDAPNVRRNTVQ